ncbi:MAG: NDP-sugar synthase [Actinomycetota bacterium]
MQAVILVGGEGTRMRPLTDTRPKPMLALVDRPIVEHQLDHLRRHGVRDVILSCGYIPDAIEAHFGDGASLGMRIRYVVDPEPLGTAGAVKNAEALIDSDEIVVRNGDILTDLDLGALRDAHRASGAAGTLTLTPVDDPSAFGLVRLDPQRRVTEFLEKPCREDLLPGEPYLINAGTYLLSRSVLDAIPAGRAVSIERETFPLVAAGGGLFGFPSDAYWRDIGNPAAYLAATLDVLSGAIRTEIPHDGRWLGDGAQVGDGADVDALAVIGRGARVGPGASVRRSVVGEEARIGPGAHLVDAVVGARVHVGEGARLEDVVVGDGAVIDAGARLVGPLSVATGERVAAAQG